MNQVHPHGRSGEQSGTIVCGVSRSGEARRVARAAADLAAGLGDRLVLVHVLSEGTAPRVVMLPVRVAAADRRDAEASLAELTGTEPSLQAAESRIETGNSVPDTLAAVAEREGAELIVIGAGSPVSRRPTFGHDVADALAARAPCPVAVIPPRAQRSMFLPPFQPQGVRRPRTRASSSRS